jgi:hypothetical protein
VTCVTAMTTGRDPSGRSGKSSTLRWSSDADHALRLEYEAHVVNGLCSINAILCVLFAFCPVVVVLQPRQQEAQRCGDVCALCRPGLTMKA